MTAAPKALAMTRHSAETRGLEGRRFFVSLAALMLLANFVGFAPTYFLKGFFDAPNLPLRTHFHGALFTAWFVLFFVQTWLVVQRNVSLHRRLGVVGTLLAAVMFLSGLVMLYFRALEYTPGGDEAEMRLIGTATVVWANLVLLLAFSTFVALGIVFRRRLEAHRRLMLLASVSMMLQAFGRVGRFPALPGSEVTWALGGLASMLVALVIHDRLALKRVHPVSLWSGPLLFAAIVLSAVVLPRTELGQALVLALVS